MFLHVVCAREDGFVYDWFLREQKLSVEELNALTARSIGRVNAGSCYKILDLSNDPHHKCNRNGESILGLIQAQLTAANEPGQDRDATARMLWLGLQLAKCEKIPRD
jgi:hypothetical protein